MSQEPSAVPQRRPGGRSARVRAAVLAATIECLVEHGYDGLTFEDVAARSGVHKTSIYRRWRTKRGLAVDALHDRSDSVIEVPDTGHLHADIVTFLRGVTTNVTTPLGRALLVATVRGDTEKTRDESLRRVFWRQRIERAAVRLERAQAAGELDPELDPHVLVELLVSPLHFRTLVSGQPIDDDLLETVTTIVLGNASVRP